jgi:hypothetical protein
VKPILEVEDLLANGRLADFRPHVSGGFADPAVASHEIEDLNCAWIDHWPE